MSYDQLVCARKQCRKCSGELINPADQCDEVGPWTRWLASRPAKVILVGQDWGTDEYFEEHQGRDVSDNLTGMRCELFIGKIHRCGGSRLQRISVIPPRRLGQGRLQLSRELVGRALFAATLAVEDNPNLRATVARQLRDLGYRV